MAQTSTFHVTLTAMATAQDILRSDFSLEDKLMKLSGLMHIGDTLIYSDKTHVSRELSTFLPRLAALPVDKTNISDILMKNVLWQMLTHIVILNDLLEKSEETFLSFVSTMFQLGFNNELPWLFREGLVSCLTELETTYPGLLARALPRIYHTLCFEKSPAIQPYLVLFSLILNHCFVLAYDIALDDLKQEIRTVTSKSSPPKGKTESGVKLSFKYVVSYRVFKSKEPTSGYNNQFQDTQMLALIKDRIKLCTPVAHSFVRQKLIGYEIDKMTFSTNLLHLFDFCLRDPNNCSSLAVLSNSDFLSLSFKNMMLSWYLSFISSTTNQNVSEKLPVEVVGRAAFCNPCDVSFKQLVCTLCRSNSVSVDETEPISSFERFTSTNTESLFTVLRYLVIASQAKNDFLVQSLSDIFISHMFSSRKDNATVINAMICEALECFKKLKIQHLVDIFSQQLDRYCLDSNKNRKIARLLGDFLPMFTRLAFMKLDFNKVYLLVFCDLMTSEEKKRFGMTNENASVFLNFLCSFLSMNPQYAVKNLLNENRKFLSDLEELDLDIARLVISVITYSCKNATTVVPCSEKFLVAPVFRSFSSDELKWTISQQPICDFATLQIPLTENVKSLSELADFFSKSASSFDAHRQVHFLLTFNKASPVQDKVCHALNIELYALSPFLNVDRKMVASYAVPVVDFGKIDENKLCFAAPIDGLSEKILYHEKLIARVSFSTGSSNIFASWLNPFTIQLCDVLVPLQLTGNFTLAGDQFVSTLSEEIRQKLDSSLGWIDSVFRTNATPEKLTSSALEKFVLLKADDYCLVGGFVPPKSLLFINFRFRGVTGLDPSRFAEMMEPTIEDDDDDDGRNNGEKRANVRDFVEKYANCCFAFIFTNNATLLRHTYLLLDNIFRNSENI